MKESALLIILSLKILQLTLLGCADIDHWECKLTDILGRGGELKMYD